MFPREQGPPTAAVTFILFLAVAFLWPAGVEGQLFRPSDRYELGQRLRRFELAWQSADAESRQRSVAAMESAVNSFFRFQLSQAGRQLDQAFLAVRAAEPATSALQWALSQRVEIEPRVADASAEAVRITLRDFYPPRVDEPAAAHVAVQVLDARQRTLASGQLDLVEARQGCVWEAGPLEPGDHMLVATLVHDGSAHELARAMLSRVERWEARLTTVTERLVTIRDNAASSPTGLATATRWQALLESLRLGSPQEIDYPAQALLELCEALLDAQGDSRRVLRADRPGEFWITLSTGRQQLPVRLRVPDRAVEPMPVLIAFHGAGGSENMFFETYGAGRLVELGAERGWLVVAPRQGLLGLPMDCSTLLDVLAEHVPVDRSRVFLVGHSMGAAQVVRQAARKPEIVAAAGALGGGRAAAGAATLREIPWFVAAGERDFGRSGARSLARSLQDAGAEVTWREYPHVEHMVIVQAALDDLFAFLDQVSARR